MKQVVYLGPTTRLFYFGVLNLFTGLLFTSGTAAATITVTNTDDSGPGSFRQALADASNGDTINFSLSGCPCTIVISSATFETTKDLTIEGPGAGLLRIP
jgi:hypothetical protein